MSKDLQELIFQVRNGVQIAVDKLILDIKKELPKKLAD
jgi:hypothetical protein